MQQFEIMPFLHRIAFLVYACLAAYVAGGGLDKPLRFAVFFSNINLAIWSLGKVILHNSITPQNAALIVQYATMFSWLVPNILLFWMAAEISGIKIKGFVYGILIAATLLLIAFGYSGNIYEMVRTDIGWFHKVKNSAGGIYYSVYGLVTLVAALYLMIAGFIRTKDGLRKRQMLTMLVFVAATIALVVPLRFIDKANVIGDAPNITGMLSAIGTVLAITAFGMLELNPLYAANNIFDSSTEYMAIVDTELKIAVANRALIEKTGLANGGSGVRFESLFSQPEKASIAVHRAIEHGNITGVDLELISGTNHAHVKLTASCMTRAGVARGAAIILTDVTEMVNYEEELMSHRDNLQEMVEERTADVVKANEELTRTNRELEEFNYVSAHDLKEPLRGITSNIELLMIKESAKLPEEEKKLIAESAKAARRMREMLVDIEQYAAINFEPQGAESSAAAALVGAIDILAGYISKTGAKITYADLPRVKAGHRELEMVFTKLIENAIKFRYDNEAPVISISCTPGVGIAEFSVKDNGIGIEPGYRDKVFKIFKRLHTLEEYEGTGMGLAICRKIIERNNGRIWVQGADGRGSDFRFTLPVGGKNA